MVMSSNDTFLAMMEPLPQWLNFLAMALGVMVAAVGALLWFGMFRKKGKRKRRHHSHEKRRINPTLAETGGLPPVRESDTKNTPTPPS